MIPACTARGCAASPTAAHARSPSTGVFIAIGHTAQHRSCSSGQLEMRGGYISVQGGSDGDATATSVARRVRRRRRRRSRLSPGDHLGRLRLHGGARCRSLSRAIRRAVRHATPRRERVKHSAGSAPQHQGSGRVRFLDGIGAIDAAAWNALAGSSQPFLRHEFLPALEESGCVSARRGWTPRHLILEDAAGRAIGAMPLYQKSHSCGEFVFDFAWAHAYAQHGLAYYPKLLAAIPFTPASGPRLLVAADADRDATAAALIAAAAGYARARGMSSWHALFPQDADAARLRAAGLHRGATASSSGTTATTGPSRRFSRPSRPRSARRRGASAAGCRGRHRVRHAVRRRARRWAVAGAVRVSCRHLLPPRPRAVPEPGFLQARSARSMPERLMLKLARRGAEPIAVGDLFLSARTRCSGATGAPAATTTACISRPATTRASITASSAGCSASSPAPRASTRSRAASSRRITWSAHCIVDPQLAPRRSATYARAGGARRRRLCGGGRRARALPPRRRRRYGAAPLIAWLAPRRSGPSGSRRVERRCATRPGCSPPAAIWPRTAARRLRARHISLVLARAAGAVVVARIRARCCFRRNSSARAACAGRCVPRGFETRVDRDFGATLRACAAPRRAGARHLANQRDDRRLCGAARARVRPSVETYGTVSWSAASTGCSSAACSSANRCSAGSGCLEGRPGAPGRGVSRARHPADRLPAAELRICAASAPRRFPAPSSWDCWAARNARAAQPVGR